jgi:hypothetical protein
MAKVQRLAFQRSAGASIVCALALACQLGPLTADARAASGTFIRVNQIGYQPDASKRAYVLSKSVETGVPFSIQTQEGDVVMRGTVGPPLGSWSSRAGSVYALDFDSLQTSGTYTITLDAGRRRVISPPFAIAPATALYTAPLERALSFYQNERDSCARFVRRTIRRAWRSRKPS